MNIAQAQQAFGRLLEIVVRLRSPDGCPWDREQTPLTLRRTLAEEAYELIHAIQEDHAPDILEELGDVALNVAMIGQMYEEAGRFTLADSLQALCEKLIRRHPHVFGDARAETSGQVIEQWEEIKRQERNGKKMSFLHKAGRGLPPLEKAQEVQKKAARVGFDWSSPEAVFDKVQEELAEVRGEWEGGHREKLELELGDLLFSVVNLARHLGIEANLALDRSVEKFKKRFSYIEEAFEREGRPMEAAHNARMEELWEEAKRRS